MTVYILLQANKRGNHIIGVFNSNALAIEYAVKYNIPSWHIQSHTLYNRNNLKKLME
jgi:hypothetical protein